MATKTKVETSTINPAAQEAVAALTPPVVTPTATAITVATAVSQLGGRSRGIQGQANPTLVSQLAVEVQRLTQARKVLVPGKPAVDAVKADKRKGIVAVDAIPATPDSWQDAPALVTGLDVDLVQRFAAICLSITQGSSTIPDRTALVLSLPTVQPGNGVSCHYRHCDAYGINYGDWTARRNALMDAGLIVGTPGRGDMGITQLGVDVWTGKTVFAGTFLPRTNGGKVIQPKAPNGAVMVAGAVAIPAPAKS